MFERAKAAVIATSAVATTDVMAGTIALLGLLGPRLLV